MDFYFKSAKSDLEKIEEGYKKLESELKNAKQKHGQFKPYIQNEWVKNKFSNYYNIDDIVKKGINAINDAIKNLEHILSFEKTDKDIDEKNRLISYENKKIIKGFIDDLTATGLNPKINYYKRNKLHTKSSQWVLELENNIPKYIEYSHNYRRISDYIERLKIEKNNLESKLQKEEKRSSHIKKLKEISIKLNLSPEQIISINFEEPDLAAENLLVYILEKNKYLMLADAMLECRLDWTDGCYGVQIALDDFNIETDEDKRIYASVSEQCEDFEDGRCFRDCEYSYDSLFDLVDKETLKTYNELKEIISECENG